MTEGHGDGRRTGEGLGERRQVSVLFADLSGFTRLAEKLDPEEVADFVNECWQTLLPIVRSYGGHVDKLLGDSLMALFGAPVAHEDDAERAARCALDLVAAAHSFRESAGIAAEDLDIHVGINSGLVYAGTVGQADDLHYTVMGDAVNVAARLQQNAGRGEIMVSATTARLLGGKFVLTEMVPLELRGKRETVEACALCGLAEAPSGLAPQEKMEGRELEWSHLEGALERAIRGEGSVVSVWGEAGIGKTRLLAELAARAVDRGIRYWSGRASELARQQAHGVWRRLLHDGLGPLETAEQLTGCMQAAGLSAEEVVEGAPYLAEVAGCRGDWGDRVGHLTGPALSARIELALGDLLRAASAEQPLILVIEDLHWADQTSLDLLTAVAPICADRPLLLITSRRPGPEGDPLERTMAALAERLGPRHLGVELGPLARADAVAVISDRLGGGRLPSEVEPLVVDKAQGNPFYLGELVRTLQERGLVRAGSDGWQLVGELTSLTLPPTVQGVITARMDTLPAAARQVLQKAAVVGRSGSVALLERIMATELGGLTDHLDDLSRRGFLRLGMERKGWDFVHALTQEAAYETILRKDRLRLHGEVAEAVEQLHVIDREDVVELLAHHAKAAQAWEKAWTYALWAGRKSMARYSSPEAVYFLTEAVALSDRLQELAPQSVAEVGLLLAEVHTGVNRFEEALAALEAAHQRLPEPDLDLSARLYKQQAVVLRNLGEYEEAAAALRRGLAVVGDRRAQRGGLELAMASLFARQGDLKEAERWCQDGMANVAEGGDMAELAHAHNLLGTIRRDLGDTAESLRQRQKSLELAEAIADLPIQVEAHNNLAVALYDLGRLDEAVYHYEQSRKISQRTGNLDRQARAEANLGEVYLLRGELGAAEDSIRGALRIWDRTGYRIGQAYGSMTLGQVQIRRGAPDQALSALAEARRIFSEMGARGFLATVERLEAEARLQRREIERAAHHAHLALSAAEELALGQEHGAALRVLGRVEVEQGNHEAGIEHLQRSLALFREAGIRYEQAQSLLALAEAGERVDRVEIGAWRTEAEQILADLGLSVAPEGVTG